MKQELFLVVCLAITSISYPIRHIAQQGKLFFKLTKCNNDPTKLLEDKDSCTANIFKALRVFLEETIKENEEGD